MNDAIKQAIEYIDSVPDDRQQVTHIDREKLIEALRAQPASKYLFNATRFKVAVRNGEAMLPCLPDELGGRWVALVAAEDDCHLMAQPDHSEMIARLDRQKRVMREALGYATFCWRDVPMNDYAEERTDELIAAIEKELGE